MTVRQDHQMRNNRNAHCEAVNTAPSQFRRSARGLTLVELVVTVLIISILAAIALPGWATSLHKQRVTQAANRVAADLARVQSAAYSSSASKTVTFTVGSSQYTVAGVNALNRPGSTYVVVLTDDPYVSTLVSVWGKAGVQTITYNGYGLPDKGGNIIVAAGGIQKTIIVDAVTGTAVIK